MIFKCSECGIEYETKIKFCEECGGKVEEFKQKEETKKETPQNICINCDAKLAENEKFCYECGTPRAVDAAKNDSGQKIENRQNTNTEKTLENDKSFEWYLREAEQGNAEAQFVVGACYYYGKGVSEDKPKAFEWYMKAAEQGNIKAQFQVARCYGSGKGVSKDKNKAFEWCMKAAEQGYAAAQFNVGVFYGDFSKDKNKAFEWCMKAVEQGYAAAQCYVGGCYYSGKGVSEDKQKAFEWYMKAAEQGYAEAQWSVGKCYEYGKVVSEDKYKTFEWVIKAAQQGHGYAQTEVAWRYHYDIIEYLTIFDKVAQSGNYTGLAAVAFIKTKSSLWSDLYIKGIKMDDDKKKNAISAYGKNIKEDSVLVLYDSTFFGSGKEGFIITDDLVIVTSTQPKKGYDLKRESHSFFNSDSYKKLSHRFFDSYKERSQDIKDSLGVLVQKYNEYSPNWK